MTTISYTYFPHDKMIPVFTALAEQGLTKVIAFGFGVAETDKRDRLDRRISVLAADTFLPNQTPSVLRDDKPALTTVEGVAGVFSLTAGRTVVDVYLLQPGKALPTLGRVAEAVVIPQSRIAIDNNGTAVITESYESPKLPKRVSLQMEGI